MNWATSVAEGPLILAAFAVPWHGNPSRARRERPLTAPQIWMRSIFRGSFTACQTEGSEVMAQRDAELSDVVEIIVRMLAEGGEDANGQAGTGMDMPADPDHGLGVR